MLIEESGLQTDVVAQLYHYLREHRRRQRLRTVRPCLLRARVNLDDQAIGADRYSRLCSGTNQAPAAGRVGWIDNYRQVTQLLQQRDGRKIQRVARSILEGSNASLTKDY